MDAGDLELRVVARDDSNVIFRWIRAFVRIAATAVTEGAWPPYSRTSLQVVDCQTNACVAEADYGRDLEGAEAARIGLADELARLGLDEFCTTYGFVRCLDQP